MIRRARGTGKIDHQGYVVIRKNGKGYRAHRLIMEEYLGRPLTREETVHHINGDRADNRLENLELWSSNQPSGQRIKDKLQWAKEIIALYGYLED